MSFATQHGTTEPDVVS